MIAAGSIADFGAIILLSIFFTGEGGTGATLLLIGSLLGARRRRAARACAAPSARCGSAPTCCACRTRPRRSACAGRWCCSSAFAAIAESLGLEAILGAFAAGAILTLLDPDEGMTHPQFRRKLEAIGFGFFIPASSSRPACATTSTRCSRARRR